MNETIGYFQLLTFTLVMGEKLECGVVLRRIVMMGEIIEYYFYLTLSIYVTVKSELA